jgi:hypothetical protein
MPPRMCGPTAAQESKDRGLLDHSTVGTFVHINARSAKQVTNRAFHQ